MSKNRYDELAHILDDGLVNALAISGFDGDTIEEVKEAAAILRAVGELAAAARSSEPTLVKAALLIDKHKHTMPENARDVINTCLAFAADLRGCLDELSEALQ